MRSKLFLIVLVITTICIPLAACSSSSAEVSSTAAGEKIYAANCLSCHPTDPNQPRVGPDLVGLSDTLRDSGMDADFILKESIIEPGKEITPGYQDLMPSADLLGLSEMDVDALVAFLSSLSAAD